MRANLLSKTAAVVAVCCVTSVLLTAGLNARAAVATKVFTGTIVLDGNISDFFQADGLTPKDGVCVANDPNGLDEPPISATASLDSLAHPSGFNQRRIMSAYNPVANNGTIYIGIDLPGGTGADSASKTVHATAGNANPNYNDGVVGANFGGGGTGRGKILPFDSDGNGEADTIGRTAAGGNLFRCPPAGGDIVDIFNCAAADATGATDNPRTASGETVGARENYVATVIFGGGVADISVELFQSGATPAGQAQVSVTSNGTSGSPGAVVSTSTGGAGSVNGFDVEIAITNVNAAVQDPCVRLNQALVVDSGSNRDGAGQGEDNNILTCEYVLPAAVQCQVLFFTNNVEVTANLCDTVVADAGVLVGTTTQLRVEVCANAGNAENIINASVNIPGVGNVTIPGPLTPGQCATAIVGQVTCNLPGLQTFMASVSAEGSISDACFPIQTDCTGSLECCGTPNVQVIKKIACLPAGGNCATLAPAAYGKTATGVKGGTQIPAFCYSITVTNTGNVALQNITVVDDVLGNLSADFADTLPVGGSETRYFTMSHSVDTMNTVIVNADGAFETGAVMSSDNANAIVKTASISCIKRVTSPDDQDGNSMDNHITLLQDGKQHQVTWSVTVTAGPGAALTNITITDQALVDLNCTLPAPFSLAAGASTNITLCTLELSCPGNISFTNTVNATANISNANGECTLDQNGQPITVATMCLAIVDCLPCPMVSVNSETICAGQSAELCATVTGGSGMRTFAWTGPNNFTATTPCITVSAAGDYCVTVTDQNGCVVGPICGKLTVNPLPPCNITGNLTICQGQTTELCGPAGLASYLWTGPQQNNATSQCITVGTAGQYNLRIIDINGCTNTCNVTVIVNPVPTCNITGPDPVCNGTTNQYNVTSSEVNSTFSWAISGNGSIVGATTGNSVSVATTGAGSYTLTVTVSKAGCSSTCTKTVVVNPIPTCNITGPDPVCNGTTNQYNVTSSEVGSSFSWAISGNGAIVGATTGSSVNVATTGAGSYTLTVTVSKAGCSSTCTKTVVVNPIPTCNITGPDPVCNGTTNTYNATSSEVGSSFTWVISGNGAIVGSTTGSSVQVRATGVGSYQLTVTVSKAGCSSTCTKTVVVEDCTPCIKVTKEIACVIGPNQCGIYGKTATGVKSATENPAFCYSITVSNCGAVALSSVTVVDNVLGNLSTSFPTSLAIGQSETRNFTRSHSANTMNTVTATGQSISGQVQSMDSANAIVKQASISCVKTVSSPDDTDGNANDNHVTLTADGNTHLVTYSVTVTAGAMAGLQNVVIADNSLAGCNGGPFSLGAGASTTIVCEVELDCADVPEGGLTNTVTVTGDVDTTAGECGYNSNGLPISVTSQCKAVVECEVIQMPGCRVTGGGKLLNTCPEVRYSTHGGQVGAPHSVETPFTPDARCIRGQWQHVRHMQGGNRGNFHSSTFDSLMCACLGCGDESFRTSNQFGGCHPDDRTYGGEIGVTPGKHYGLCNADDKKNGCGPEPRPAPANKICFSGVGDYAERKGSREPRSVAFRVDIEDRSEPGGSHPRGGKAPPDRYRIRIWFLNGDEAVDGSSANLALRQSIACSNPLTEVVPAREPDIDDGGDLSRGNHQLHPQTGSTCR